MKQMLYARLAIAAMSAVSTAPSSGLGMSEGKPVTMTFTHCPSVSEEEVMRILDLELGMIAAGRDDVIGHPTAVRVTCDRGLISLAAVDQKSGTTRRQKVEIDEGAADGKERLIAIASAELLFSSWIALSDAAPPEASSTGAATGGKAPSPHAKTDRTSPSKAPVVTVGFSALWRLFAESRTSLFGGEIGVALRLVGPLYLAFGGTMEGGRATRPLGEVILFGAGGRLSVGATRTFFSAVRAGADVGVRAGYGALRGKPEDEVALGHKVAGGFGGPLLRLTCASDSAPSAGLSVESGYAAWGNTGSVAGGRSVTMKGIWFSLTITIAVDI